MPATTCPAQATDGWQQVLAEVMSLEDEADADWEELMARLEDLAQHPADINRMRRDDWERMPFLSAQQIEQLVEYRDRYGAMTSMNELRMLSTLDAQRRLLLQTFFYAGQEQQPGFPTLTDISRYGRHELMTSVRVPTYQRQGDRDGYAGYPYKHWLRYQFGYGDYVKAGVVGAQDAGEPFFSGRNSWGYDYYAAYLKVSHWRCVETAIVGSYKVSTGMGLVVNNGFNLGKLATLSQLGRTVQTVRPHSSRSSADYFQGAAVSVNLSRQLTATAFASYRPLDATLNQDGTARTLLTDGYHRTTTEMAKKHNIHATEGGLNARLHLQRFHLGATALYSHLDRELRPDIATRYRRYYPQGSHFLAASVDYGYRSSRLTVSGETALNQDGALATLNSASLAWGSVTLLALQRFYSYRYATLHARSFSNGGTVQNESGLYVGVTWTPSPRWQLTAYSDYAYSPWARYRISASSHAWDHLLQLRYSRRQWTAGARYRRRQRQRDVTGTHELEDYTVQTARLWTDWHVGTRWRLHTQADASLVGSSDLGFMVSQNAAYQHQALRLNAGLGYFRTDSYDSRLYVYESGPLYTFATGLFSGRGVRYWLMVRWQPTPRLMLTAKGATTNYLDRPVIGSGLQLIDHSSMTDVDLQLRWKF